MNMRRMCQLILSQALSDGGGGGGGVCCRVVSRAFMKPVFNMGKGVFRFCFQNYFFTCYEKLCSTFNPLNLVHLPQAVHPWVGFDLLFL